MAFSLAGYNVGENEQPVSKGDNPGKQFIDAMNQIQQTSLLRREQERKAAETAITVEKHRLGMESLAKENEAFKYASDLNERTGNLLKTSEIVGVAGRYAVEKGNVAEGLAMVAKQSEIGTKELEQKKTLLGYQKEEQQASISFIRNVISGAPEGKQKEFMKNALPEFEEKFPEQAKVLKKNWDNTMFFEGMITTDIRGTHKKVIINTKDGTSVVVDDAQIAEMIAAGKGSASREDKLTEQSKTLETQVNHYRDYFKSALINSNFTAAQKKNGVGLTEKEKSLMSEYDDYMLKKQQLKDINEELVKKIGIKTKGKEAPKEKVKAPSTGKPYEKFDLR